MTVEGQSLFLYLKSAHSSFHYHESVKYKENELAAKAGVSKPTIYEYINGKSPLSAAFVRLCAYLNADPHEILIETEAAFAEDENVQTSY